MATKSAVALRQELLKVLLFAALALFLIPALTYGFVRYANHDRDTTFLRMVEDKAYVDKNASSDDKQADVCAPYGEVWQFNAMRSTALWTPLGGLAFVNRKWQHASFIIGWRLMTLASAAEVVLQFNAVVGQYWRHHQVMRRSH